MSQLFKSGKKRKITELCDCLIIEYTPLCAAAAGALVAAICHYDGILDGFVDDLVAAAASKELMRISRYMLCLT